MGGHEAAQQPVLGQEGQLGLTISICLNSRRWTSEPSAKTHFFFKFLTVHHPRICVWHYAKTDVFVFIFILVANDAKAYLTPGYCIIIFSSVLFQVVLYIIIYCDLKFVIVFFIFFPSYFEMIIFFLSLKRFS